MTLGLVMLTFYAGSVLAGVIGALAGLGGGILIVPLLTAGFAVGRARRHRR